jgi:hypothetical protein
VSRFVITDDRRAATTLISRLEGLWKSEVEREEEVQRLLRPLLQRP